MTCLLFQQLSCHPPISRCYCMKRFILLTTLYHMTTQKIRSQHTLTLTYTCTCMYAYTHAHVCMYVYMYVHMHVHIHLHVCMYGHTCIHTHTLITKPDISDPFQLWTSNLLCSNLVVIQILWVMFCLTKIFNIVSYKMHAKKVYNSQWKL